MNIFIVIGHVLLKEMMTEIASSSRKKEEAAENVPSSVAHNHKFK